MNQLGDLGKLAQFLRFGKQEELNPLKGLKDDPLVKAASGFKDDPSKTLGERTGTFLKSMFEGVKGKVVESAEDTAKVIGPLVGFGKEVAQGFKSEDPSSTANATPEMMQQAVDAAKKEATQTLETASSLEPKISDEKLRENIGETLGEIKGNTELQQIMRNSLKAGIGLREDPSRESLKMATRNLKDIDALLQGQKLRHDSLFNKDPKTMSNDEKISLALVTALPALLGGLVGGKKGLMKGIAAGLAGAGQILKGPDGEDISKLEENMFKTLALKDKLIGTLSAEEDKVMRDGPSLESPIPGTNISDAKAFQNFVGDKKAVRELAIKGEFTQSLGSLVEDVKDQIRQGGIPLTGLSEQGAILEQMKGKLIVDINNKIAKFGGALTESELERIEALFGGFIGPKAKFIGPDVAVRRLDRFMDDTMRDFEGELKASGLDLNIKEKPKTSPKSIEAKAEKEGVESLSDDELDILLGGE